MPLVHSFRYQLVLVLTRRCKVSCLEKILTGARPQRLGCLGHPKNWEKKKIKVDKGTSHSFRSEIQFDIKISGNFVIQQGNPIEEVGEV